MKYMLSTGVSCWPVVCGLHNLLFQILTTKNPHMFYPNSSLIKSKLSDIKQQ